MRLEFEARMRRTSRSAPGTLRAAELSASPLEGEDMTTARIAAAAAEGYWTIQIIDSKAAAPGRRYVCHAHDDAEAQSIAGHLAGSATSVVGYDYHRIDNPHGRYARALGLGQSEPIDDPDAWAVLQAARRSN